MSPETAAPLSVAVSVHTHAPSFVPGSRVSATITLHADPKSFQTSRSAYLQPPERPPIAQSASATSSLASFPHDAVARADYVVCEFSGKWSTDRTWVTPSAHPPASPNASLDNHTHPPLASASTPRVISLVADPTIGPYPWSAALADANSVGGGAREGYSGTIFRSQPLVVCEREQIPAGSQVSFDVDCVLPDRLPPTLRGAAVRYTYVIIVVIKSPDSDTLRVVRVPFRVVSAGGTADDEKRSMEIIPVPTPRGVGPAPNRFLQEKDAVALSMSARLLKRAPPDDIEIALALSLNGRLTPYKADVNQSRSMEGLENGGLSTLRDLAVIASPKPGMDADSLQQGTTDSKKRMIPVYSITRGRDSVARLHLAKKVHLLGDTVLATFYFQGDLPCYRLDARLEAQEIIHRDFCVGQKPGQTSESEQAGVRFRKVYGEHGEFVMSNRNTHIAFSLPHDAPPSFATEVVTVRWLLHFVFLIPKRKVATDGVAAAGISDEVTDDVNGTLLDSSHRAQDADDDDPGWEGGVWSGEDPSTWKHLPQKEVDVLRWTLPIVVSGRAGSQWGTRSVGKLLHKHDPH